PSKVCLLLPISLGNPSVRPRSGAGPARLCRRIHTPRPARHRPRADAGRRSRLRRRVAAPSWPRLGRRPAVVLAGGSFFPFPTTTGEPAMKTRVLSVSLAAALSVSLLVVQPASALTVFDPSNFVQNTLTAVR